MDSLVIYRFTDSVSLTRLNLQRELIRGLRYQLPGDTFYFLDYNFLEYGIYLVCQKKLPRPAVKVQIKNKSKIYIFKEVIEDGLDFIPGLKESNKYLGSNCIGERDFSGFITYNPHLGFLSHIMTKKYKERN